MYFKPKWLIQKIAYFNDPLLTKIDLSMLILLTRIWWLTERGSIKWWEVMWLYFDFTRDLSVQCVWFPSILRRIFKSTLKQHMLTVSQHHQVGWAKFLTFPCEATAVRLLHSEFIIFLEFALHVASHTGVFKGGRVSSLLTNACSTDNNIPFPRLANHIVLSKFWKVNLDRKVTW